MNSAHEFLCHKSCYSSYTSKTNLGSIQESPSTSDHPSCTQLRQKQKTFDFKELCLFRGKKSRNKDKTLIRVSTFEFGEIIKQRADSKGDDQLKITKHIFGAMHKSSIYNCHHLREMAECERRVIFCL